jgi:DNA-directed RNA polymerase specialized sigma24 family protein
VDPKRVVRLDLGSISAPLARQILEQTESAVEAEVRRLRPALRHVAGIDEDDLRSLGQIAALESYLTWDAERGCALRTWAGRLIRWRLTEAVQLAQSPEQTAGSVPRAAAEEAVDPTEGYDAAERAEWLQSTLGGLTPRLRVLVAARLRGETGREAGRTLGISDALASSKVLEALRILHRAAVDDGLGDR